MGNWGKQTMHISKVENMKKIISIIFFIAVVGFLVYIIGINAISQINKKKYQDENYVIEKAI